MAGKIIADTIETGAGADISTSYVVNGSAKAWVNFNGQGTVATNETFNASSITDLGTGNYQVNFANALLNGNYSANVTGAYSDSGLTSCSSTNTCRSHTTTSMRATSAGTSNSGVDMVRMCVLIHGELA
jgi:hypothetical protein